MSKTAEPADINVDELRRRARRRLVGAVVLALGVAVVVPMLLETEQKPLGEDVSVKIPPVDDGKFVNRLNDPKAPSVKPQDAAPSASEPASPPAPSDAPAHASKYDTRIPDATAAATQNGASPDSTAPAHPSPPAAPAPQTADAHPSNATPDKAASGSERPVIITDKGASANERPATSTSERATASERPAPVATERTSASASQRSSSSASERASATSAHRDGFAVQLAAFADDKGANSLAGRLKRAGYAAYTEPLKTSKGTLWRVRVGPYPSREAALAARDKLKTEGQNGIVAAIR
ncbi:MAG TPA: SPOR domain-containing protein [Casimicrobiaceae bacterium]|nr:SPOR domain-containing protein [Casimicrobiaceae bacterium]